MLDEEVRLPKGSDANLLTRLHHDHDKHPHYRKPRIMAPTFIVAHYAGDVTYSITGCAATRVMSPLFFSFVFFFFRAT